MHNIQTRTCCERCDICRDGLLLSSRSLRLLNELVASRSVNLGSEMAVTQAILATLEQAIVDVLEAALAQTPSALPSATGPGADVGTPPSPPGELIRTYLDTSDGMESYAERFGASFDAGIGQWYVDGNVPGVLQGLIPVEKRRERPACPLCGGPTLLRDEDDTEPHYRCRAFPVCRGKVPIRDDEAAPPSVSAFLPALPAHTSERLPSELSRLRHLAVAGATAAFGGDGRRGADWLTSPNVALGNESPLKAMGSTDGAHRVLQLIERLAETT